MLQEEKGDGTTVLYQITACSRSREQKLSQPRVNSAQYLPNGLFILATGKVIPYVSSAQQVNGEKAK